MPKASPTKLSNEQLWTLGQWLSAKELTSDDTLEALAIEAGKLVERQLTIYNIEGVLKMVNKRIPSKYETSDTVKLRLLASFIKGLYVSLSMPIPQKLEDIL